jgi:Flp pilus assembly protein TadG
MSRDDRQTFTSDDLAPVRRTGVAMPQSRTVRRVARFVRSFRCFPRDDRGVAAVEFGLIAPMMIVLLFGMIDITRAVAIDRRFGEVTATIADLVAREPSLTKNDVEKMYEIANLIMAPYDASSLTISVIPVASNPTDANKTVVYPATTNRPTHPEGHELARCTAYTLPKDIILANESVIVVETTYTFSPLFFGLLDGLLPSGSKVWPSGLITWNDKAYAKPRKAACVDFDGNNKPCGSCFS